MSFTTFINTHIRNAFRTTLLHSYTMYYIFLTDVLNLSDDHEHGCSFKH